MRRKNFTAVLALIAILLIGAMVTGVVYSMKNSDDGKTTPDERTQNSTNTDNSVSPEAPTVYYIRDGGSGDGSSVEKAGASLQDAYAAVGSTGGTIVVTGRYTQTEAFKDIRNEKPITITSLYDGVNYAETRGAKFTIKANFYCGGDTLFENITIRASGEYLSIFADNHSLTLGDGITCERVLDFQYPSVMGGSRSAMFGAASNLVINSGTWQRGRGGTAADGSLNYAVHLTINGGTFIERLTLGDSQSHSGDITAVINGGTFYQGIYASTLSKASDSFSGKVNLTLNGGTFYGKIAPAASNIGTYSGSFNVSINGGEFAHLVSLSGTEGLSGSMTSTLDATIDITEEETGTYTFTNYVRADGADPWLFYHDGFYYYTSTTGSATLKLVKVANIGDLIHSGGTVIYSPEKGKPYSDSSWSPEIHYYTDEEVGPGNGGWYCYLAGADNSITETETAHRMYVLKCLDGDNLLGRWGNPVTGEVNVPQIVDAPEIENFHDTWAAGMTDIRIGGKVYTMYVSVIDGNNGVRYQTINIVEMTNPWTISGKPEIICTAEYDWEIGNHKKLYIVECGTAVYGEDGSIYIVYSACGYSTPDYKLGQLKYLGGDPTDKRNWEKAPEPILSRSDTINGCGSACYVTDTAGQGWICYNAYIGATSGGNRYAFVEPYTATAENGVVIGEGTRHPADIETVYTAPLNPLPLSKKISAFPLS